MAGRRPSACRWSALPAPVQDPTRRLHVQALALLERHGILIRGAAAAERVSGGFGALYPVLRALEDAGRVAGRGYFVEGLGAAQFALPGAVDRMRAMAEAVRANAGRAKTWRANTGPADTGPADTGRASSAWAGTGRDGASTTDPWDTGGPPGPDPWNMRPRGGSEPTARVVVLAAADPASAYGAALPWPDRPERPGESAGGHRPGRKAGALVVLADGALVLYVERGGKTLLSWTSEPDVLEPAAAALAAAVRAGALGRLTVERADGGASTTRRSPGRWRRPASGRPRGACGCAADPASVSSLDGHRVSRRADATRRVHRHAHQEALVHAVGRGRSPPGP